MRSRCLIATQSVKARVLGGLQSIEKSPCRQCVGKTRHLFRPHTLEPASEGWVTLVRKTCSIHTEASVKNHLRWCSLSRRPETPHWNPREATLKKTPPTRRFLILCPACRDVSGVMRRQFVQTYDRSLSGPAPVLSKPSIVRRKRVLLLIEHHPELEISHRSLRTANDV
jgi:hypothetical protein